MKTVDDLLADFTSRYAHLDVVLGDPAWFANSPYESAGDLYRILVQVRDAREKEKDE